MSRSQSNFWGMRREDLEEEIEDHEGELATLKERYQRVIDLNVELMEQLERQVEISRDLYQKLKDKSGEKPERNFRTRHPKKGYA